MKKFRFLTLPAMLAALIATAPAMAEAPPSELVAPIADYKIWVGEEMDKLIADTQKFTNAIKAGDLEKAKALYAPTRVSYEHIEPIAELFSDLDKRIDARADDFENKETDPNFSGFHRLEYGLFSKNTTDGLTPIADKLLAYASELRERVKTLAFPPDKVVGGAAVLIEEVAQKKLSGEEDRYSHTDLWDFKSNVDGARKIYGLLRPLAVKQNADLIADIDKNFAKVDALLSKYAAPNGGYVSYEKVSDQDRIAMRGPINALAEDLSKLRGIFGLS